MMFEDEFNYTILSFNIDKEFLSKLSSYTIIDDTLSYRELEKRLEFFASKRVILNNSFYNLREREILNILELLEKEKVKFVNITSNIEEVLFSDKLIVYDKSNKKVLEGDTKEVLKQEKVLKRLGYGLPFVVDLSRQLMVYEVLDKEFYNMDSLEGELWS